MSEGDRVSTNQWRLVDDKWDEGNISSHLTLTPNGSKSNPRYSMYLEYNVYLPPQKKTNVGKYSIHGASGYVNPTVLSIF